MTYSHIIIGAGTAGCILAEGLSRDPDNRVLLVEAGPDYGAAERLPPELIDGTTPAIGSHDWGILAFGPRSRRMHLPQGKVVAELPFEVVP